MKSNWKDTPMLTKLATVSSIIVSLAIVVLAILQMFDIWRSADYVYLPLLGVSMLLQAYTQWKNSRGVSIFSLCVAVFIFTCTAVVLILP